MTASHHPHFWINSLQGVYLPEAVPILKEALRAFPEQLGDILSAHVVIQHGFASPFCADRRALIYVFDHDGDGAFIIRIGEMGHGHSIIECDDTFYPAIRFKETDYEEVSPVQLF